MGLADLNTYSEEQIVFTDNRDATVLFLLPQPADLDRTENSLVFNINNPYKIDEIIRPDDCLPTLSVDVSGLSGTTVTWSTIPAGSTVTESNDVYTIDNIIDVDTYDVVKTPTITVPNDFQGTFVYTVSVNYITSSGVESYSWQVNTDIPVAQLSSATAFIANAMKLKSLESSLASEFIMPSVDLAIEMLPATFNATASLTSTAILRKNVGIAPMLPEFTLTATPTEITPYSNFAATLYRKNAYDVSFPNTSEPWLSYQLDESVLPNYTSVRTILTVSDGLLLRSNGNQLSGEANLTGTNYNNQHNHSIFSSGSTVDDVTYYPNQTSFYGANTLRGVLFYPPHNSTSDITYNLKIYIDGALRENYNGTLSYSSTVNAPEPEGYIVPNLFDTVWNKVFVGSLSVSGSNLISDPLPSAYARSYHNRIDLYVIGAGGGGSGTTVTATEIAGGASNGAGGGDGGNTAIFTAIPYTSNSVITFKPGAGGTGGSGANNGTAGGSSIVTIDGTTYTATGGAGGQVGSAAGSNGTNQNLIPSDISTPEYSDNSESGGLGGSADNGFGVSEKRGKGGNGAHYDVYTGNTGGHGMVFYRTYRV